MSREPSDHQPDIDPQGLWQSQKKEYDPMTLADIHLKARTFESRIQRRNAVEYVACGVVIVGFAPALLNGPHWLMRVGAGLIMLAVPFVAWQLHRRGSVDASPEPDETLVDSYRRQLARQRDALRSVGSWYLAPFVPGLALLMVGAWFTTPKPGMSVERFHAGLLVVWAIIAVIRMRGGASQTKAQLDELDKLLDH